MDEFIELGCPACGGSLRQDGQRFTCGYCEFHGAENDGIIDLRVNSTNADEQRDLRDEPGLDEDAKVRLVWPLFWPPANSGGVLHVGSGNGHWHRNCLPKSNRVYFLRPTWQRNAAPAEEPGETRIVRVASADAPRLPFRSGTMDVISVTLPLLNDNVHALLNWTQNRESREPALFEEVRRILKPDGTLLLFAPNAFSYQFILPSHVLARLSRFLPADVERPTAKPTIKRGHRDRFWLHSLHGYRSILQRAGFTKICAIGFLDEREHSLLVPIDGAIPNWDSRKPGTLKRFIKSHRWFLPSFGIRASSGAQSATCWEQMVRQFSLANAGSKQLSFYRCLLTGKNKALFFGSADGARFLLKIPIDEAARESEHRNWSFLELANGLQAARAPRPVFRSEVQGFEYFVESRVAGTPVSALVDRDGEAAGLEPVADYLGRLHDDSGLVATEFDSDLLERFIVTPTEVLASIVETNERLEKLASHLLTKLEGTAAILGLTHGDLSVSNVFLGEEGVAGVIDWADFTQDGLPVLDVIGHAESRVRRARKVPLTTAISIILDGNGDDPIRVFIEGLGKRLQIAPETFESYAYLYWLHHMRLRSNEGAIRGNGRLRAWVQKAIELLPVLPS